MRSNARRSASRPVSATASGMLAEALGHPLGRGQHVRGVAAPPRLRLVERRAQANRHHRVLERHALERVHVHVAGGHARHPEPLGELAEQAVAAPVVAGEGPLELDAEALRPEGPQQPARDRGRAGMVARLHPAGHRAVAGAAGEADEPLGVVLDLLERDARLRRRAGPGPGRLPARTPGAGSVQPSRAQRRVRQWAAVISRQRFVYPWRVSHRSVRCVPSSSVSSAPVIGRTPSGAQRPRHLHGAVQPVVVGQREGAVALVGGGSRQLGRMRRPVEERVGRVAVELPPATATGHEHMFASRSSGEAASGRRLAPALVPVERLVGAGHQPVGRLVRLVHRDAEARLDRLHRLRRACRRGLAQPARDPLGVQRAWRPGARPRTRRRRAGRRRRRGGGRCAARPRGASGPRRRPRGRACRSASSGCPCRRARARTCRCERLLASISCGSRASSARRLGSEVSGSWVAS